MIPAATAVFIEPQGSLRAALVEKKALLEARFPSQAYTLHPPHATLIFGPYGPPEAWLSTLAARLAETPRFTLATTGWQEFPHDPMTHGGHTLAYCADLSPDLIQLQRLVAKTLAPFYIAPVDEHPLANTEPFGESLRRYGSPFIGTHWIPHFTIGSPRVAPADPLLALLKSSSPLHLTEVNSLSIWRVDGEAHERLHELALGQTSRAKS